MERKYTRKIILAALSATTVLILGKQYNLESEKATSDIVTTGLGETLVNYINDKYKEDSYQYNPSFYEMIEGVEVSIMPELYTGGDIALRMSTYINSTDELSDGFYKRVNYYLSVYDGNIDIVYLQDLYKTVDLERLNINMDNVSHIYGNYHNSIWEDYNKNTTL